MQILRFTQFGLLLCAAGCAATGAPTTGNAQRVRATEASAPAPAAADAAPAAAAFAPSCEHTQERLELDLFDDPAFKQRFIESYLSESEIEPRVTTLDRERMQEVFGLMAGEQFDQAIALLETYRTESGNALYDFTLANLYFQTERLEAAAAAYRAAVEKHPKFRRAWGNLALAHARQAEFQPAVEAFAKVIELGAGDAVTYGLLGIAHTNLRDPLAAESAFRMAILLAPHTVEWKMGLAESLFKQERFADAAALCESLIRAEPERAELWMLQANSFARLQQPLRAAENLELVDRLGKSTPESLNLLGDIYTNEQLFDLAAGYYGRAMEADLDAGPARAVRAARDLNSRGALAESQQLIEQIERVHAGNLDDQARKDLLKLRARIAVANGADDEQARVLEEIVALDPLDGEALILLGQHHSRAGDSEQALFFLERAASLEAFEAEAARCRAQVLVRQGRYAEALPLLRRAQTLDPREDVRTYLESVERFAQSR